MDELDEAGFRHIAAQNTRTPEQHMTDVAAATLRMSLVSSVQSIASVKRR